MFILRIVQNLQVHSVDKIQNYRLLKQVVYMVNSWAING